jgi:transposase
MRGWLDAGAFDDVVTTNLHTYIASHNTRNELAQRGHHKPGRHHLRQVGLSYVLDGENGLSLCHPV